MVVTGQRRRFGYSGARPATGFISQAVAKVTLGWLTETLMVERDPRPVGSEHVQGAVVTNINFEPDSFGTLWGR